MYRLNFLAFVLFIVAALLAFAPAAMGDNCTNPDALWGVGGSASAGAGGGPQATIIPPITQRVATQFNCMRSGTASVSLSNSSSDPNTGLASSGDGFASLSVSIGHIGASSFASGESYGGGSGSASGEFRDFLTVTSSKYSNGTAVPFQLGLDLSAEFAGDGYGLASTFMIFCAASGNGCGVGVAGPQISADSNGNVGQYDNLTGAEITGSSAWNWSQTVDLTVGQTYMIDGVLQVEADASGDGTSTSISENVVATHSAAFSVTPLDVSSSYTTLSGCTLNGTACNQNPTPTHEPASFFLLGSSMAILGSWFRKRRLKDVQRFGGLYRAVSLRSARFQFNESTRGGWFMTYRGLFRAFTFLLVLSFAHLLLADTLASTSAKAGNSASEDKTFQYCPSGPCIVAQTAASLTPNAGTLQSQASDGNSSAEAHVDLGTGSMGVAANGNASADAQFSNAFYCASTSPCEFVRTGGIPALLHLSMEGTITPPSLAENSTIVYGGFLQLGYDYVEHDIGGGALDFHFETDYDDTLDPGAPKFQLTFDGQSYTPAYTYQTQPDGTVKVSVSWDQPFTLCPNGCIGVAAASYTISSGGAEASLFGTSEKAYIDSSGFGGADFSHTFSTSITSLDPRYSFFSDSGVLAPTQSNVPEPSSLILLGSGLAGLAGTFRRKLKR